MHGQTIPFAPGTLLLDFFNYRNWLPSGVKPLSYVPVCRIERAGSKFYTLGNGGRPYRVGISTLNKRSLPLPADVPWHFPSDFSAMSRVARLADHSHLWCVDHLGRPFPRGEERIKDEFDGHIYTFPKEFPLKVCGYALREIVEGERTRWYWSRSLLEILATMKRRVTAAEDVTPDSHMEFPPLVQTSLADGPDKSISLGPFPQELQASDVCVHLIEFLDNVSLWVIRLTWPSGLGEGKSSRLQDEPIRISWLAWDATVFSASNLYYSNDGKRWWRKLSEALGCEIDRLRRTSSLALPSMQ